MQANNKPTEPPDLAMSSASAVFTIFPDGAYHSLITLTNASQTSILAVKTRVNAKQVYRARPNTAKIAPADHLQVEFVVQAPVSSPMKRHKILIQYARCAEPDDVMNGEFWQNHANELCEKKLPVVFPGRESQRRTVRETPGILDRMISGVGSVFSLASGGVMGLFNGKAKQQRISQKSVSQSEIGIGSGLEEELVMVDRVISGEGPEEEEEEKPGGGRILELESRCATFQKQTEQLEAAITQSKHEVADLQGEKAKLQQRADDLEAKANIAKGEADAQSKKLTAMQDAIKEFDTRLDKKTKDADSLEKALSAAQKEAEDKGKANAEKITALEAETKKLREEKEQLEAKLREQEEAGLCPLCMENPANKVHKCGRRMCEACYNGNRGKFGICPYCRYMLDSGIYLKS